MPDSRQTQIGVNVVVSLSLAPYNFVFTNHVAGDLDL